MEKGKQQLISVLIAGILVLIASAVHGQVQIDKPLQLTGAGLDARVMGIKAVSNDLDAANKIYVDTAIANRGILSIWDTVGGVLKSKVNQPFAIEYLVGSTLKSISMNSNGDFEMMSYDSTNIVINSLKVNNNDGLWYLHSDPTNNNALTNFKLEPNNGLVMTHQNDIDGATYMYLDASSGGYQITGSSQDKGNAFKVTNNAHAQIFEVGNDSTTHINFTLVVPGLPADSAGIDVNSIWVDGDVLKIKR